MMLNLHKLMRVNASSCIFFGFIFALYPSVVASFLAEKSPAPDWLISTLGVALIVNGLHLGWVSKARRPKKGLILYFSVGDFLWVIASIALMISGVWITTINGIFIASAVAAIVGALGILQIIKR